MDYFKKQELKNFFRKKWYWFLTSGIFLIILTVIFFVGLSITGWNIIEWLHSKWAITTLACFLFLIAALAILYINWRRYQLFKK